MTDRYISFTGEMADKIFRGLKTQTRRIMKPQPERLKDADGCYWWHLSLLDGFISWQCGFHARKQELLQKWASPYKPGDIVLIREPARYASCWNQTKPSEIESSALIEFYPFARKLLGKLRPPMFLPRRFVRQAIRITEVRAERLQDISEADARAEGCESLCTSSYAASFKQLWESINGKGSWGLNPFCWVCTFERCEVPKIEGEEK